MRNIFPVLVMALLPLTSVQADIRSDLASGLSVENIIAQTEPTCSKLLDVVGQIFDQAPDLAYNAVTAAATIGPKDCDLGGYAAAKGLDRQVADQLIAAARAGARSSVNSNLTINISFPSSNANGGSISTLRQSCAHCGCGGGISLGGCASPN